MLQKFKFFIIIGILILAFLPGFARLQELKQKLADIQDQIEKVQKQNAAFEERITQLQSNQDYLEIVAREQMGVVKKGETVLKIVHEGEEIPSLPQNVTATNTTKTKLP